MRISDWSSDVCSSDLDAFEPERLARLVPLARQCGADMLADNLLLESDDGGTEPMLAPSEAASCAPMSAADFLLGNLPDPEHPRKSYGFLKPLIARSFLERHGLRRSEEHTSELQSLMRISYAVFCLKKKKK